MGAFLKYMSNLVANSGLAIYRSQAISLSDNDEVSLAVSSTGRLLVDASITVDNITLDTEFPAAAALGDATANPTTTLSEALLGGFNGTTWDRIRSGAQSNVAAATGYLASLGIGQYNASAPTITDGRYNHFQLDVNGNLKTSLATLIAGENLTTNRLNVEPIYSFLNITTNTTTTVKSGAGTFAGFTVNNNGFTTAGTITIYDNTAGSGTKIGTWTIPIEPPGSTVLGTAFFPPQLGLNASFSTGLTIVTATTAPACDITVLYR
jgi:hypothetical protein